MFSRLIHADWSTSPQKRWLATAHRTRDGWSTTLPTLVPELATFQARGFGGGNHERTLVGFDFPIGLPTLYGGMTGFSEFKTFLRAAGSGAWSTFFDVAKCPAEISLRRPFYPDRANRGVLRQHLLDGLKATGFDELLRECERATGNRRSACPLFWTLGGNQVGKAAISGWRDVVKPALESGARIWPFDGNLSEIAADTRPVICETYPAEACAQIGVQFGAGESKRRQIDRASKAKALQRWAKKEAIALSDETHLALENGFGSSASGEDQFDALVGLLAMIPVVQQRRRDLPRSTERIRIWEGWILGQA